jgi:hypothetical protein
MPYAQRTFQIDFDFIDHRLLIATAEGHRRELELRPRTVADFHAELFTKLDELGLPVAIDQSPNEVEDATPFDQDHAHAAYDADQASRFWRILLHSERVMQRFRSKFIGKCSPVHFFWGSFDLAVTRFSGRPAPPHPGGIPHLPDKITREAYSHEVSSAGFWPGGGGVDYAAYYSYAYPAPPGFERGSVRPAAAFFHDTLREFILPYDDVRAASSPDDTLLGFLQSTYEAAAEHANWDRAALEREFSPREGGRDRG